MSIEAKEIELISRFHSLVDLHERLDFAVQSGLRRMGLNVEEKIEMNLVQGCVSKVWLVPETKEHHLFLRFDAESKLVGGLVGLICDVYEDQSIQEVGNRRTELLSRLGFNHLLSPTRQQGLRSVIETICLFAEAQN
jgi:cysteine desulfuration protein SufE